MRGLWPLTKAQLRMLRRQPEVLIVTLGLPLLSMLVFGYVFGRTAALDIGIVDQDRGSLAQGVLKAFKDTKALAVHEGSEATEMERLKDGSNLAVILLPQGFSAGPEQGRLHLFKNEANPILDSIRDGAIRSIIAGINESLARESLQVAVQEEGVTGRVLRTIDFMTPGMMGMSIMWLNFAAGIFLVNWRQLGILRRLQVTPLTPQTIIASQVLSFSLFSLAQVALLLLVGRVIFHVPIEGNVLGLIPIGLAGIAAMLSISYTVASLMRTMQATNAVVNLIAFPMMFLGGSYFPVDSVPGPVRAVVRVIPLTYLNDGLRAVMNRGHGPEAYWGGALFLAVCAVIFFGLAARVFRWD